MKRERPAVDTTEIKWDYELEVFACTKCRAMMSVMLGFEYCPFCGRKVIKPPRRKKRVA